MRLTSPQVATVRNRLNERSWESGTEGATGAGSVAVRLTKKSVTERPSGPRCTREVMPALSTPPPLGLKSARNSVS